MPPATLLLEEPASALLPPAAAVASCASAVPTQCLHNSAVVVWVSIVATWQDLLLSVDVKELFLAETCTCF